MLVYCCSCSLWFYPVVEQEISGHIGEMVKEAVGECLQAHVPDGLQAEMEDNKKELERARIALHNSSVTCQRSYASYIDHCKQRKPTYE